MNIYRFFAIFMLKCLLDRNIRTICLIQDLLEALKHPIVQAILTMMVAAKLGALFCSQIDMDNIENPVMDLWRLKVKLNENISIQNEIIMWTKNQLSLRNATLNFCVNSEILFE